MRSHLPLLCCISLLLAPACMAQSHPVDPAAEEAEDQPRSAFGRVMGIMIEALRQEAMLDAGAGTVGVPQKIEVGANFRLQAVPQRLPSSVLPSSALPTSVDAPCDVQPCERDSIANLRIASQK